MDLSGFADEVGDRDPVTIAGTSTRGGAVAGVRCVTAPSGIEWIEPEEMTLRCGAATPVAELDDALSVHGQEVAVPPEGTIGGALAVGRSGVRRLGYGPVREVLLQARYVSATGEVVTAGGPTVKNVSGFDVCRLLVGSRGTLGFFGDAIIRTRPRAAFEQWFHGECRGGDPNEMLRSLYRPVSLLWDGITCWALLTGQRADVEATAAGAGMSPITAPPSLAGRQRWSVPPSQLASLHGDFIAEVGVGIVHHRDAPPARPPDPGVVTLSTRLKAQFDPTGRLNPGVDVLADGP